jgi:8-oxo-dGTP pyrophosphatase MutT (NUDIX family)
MLGGVFHMLVRNCAGGIVFFCDEVFLLKNEKEEWVFPKGIIHDGDLANEVAIRRVREETGITAVIVSTAGQTNYEFFSMTRQKPVCNKIIWYVMKTFSSNFVINKEENFTDGGFFDIDKAISLISYSQDKSILNLSFKMYKKLDELAG